jgi:hypothetical protein
MSASTAPTLEYSQHHQVEAPIVDASTAFRPYWRRRDRLAKLCTEKLITPRELRAAIGFRIIWNSAHRADMHASAWDAARLDRHCRRPSSGPGEQQLAALRRLAAIRQALGVLFVLIEWLVIEEASWCEIGRRLDVHHATAKTWTLAALAALAGL